MLFPPAKEEPDLAGEVQDITTADGAQDLAAEGLEGEVSPEVAEVLAEAAPVVAGKTILI